MHSRSRARRLARWVPALLVALATLGPAEPAQAKDLSGKLGIGVETSLGGVSGLALRYWPSSSLGLLVGVGVDVTTVEKTRTDDEGQAVTNSGLATSAQFSIGFVYNFARSIHANLGAGARLAIDYLSREAVRLVDPASDEQRVAFQLELPLTLEFFLAESFSLSVATGILIDFTEVKIPNTDTASTDSQSTTLRVGIGSGSATATLGLMYYF